MTKKIIVPLAIFTLGAILGNIAAHSYSSFDKNEDSAAISGESSCKIDLASGQELPSDLAAAKAYLKFKKIKSSFIPSGVPAVYGRELDISFDKVQEAINKVRVFGPTYGEKGKKIVLTGADLDRYIDIGSKTACQYCCGVKTLVRENGTAACGCAHSIMMRGLAAYLIKNHPQMSNQEILDELNTWKISYFPKQTLSAELSKLEASGEPGIKEILQEFPDFLPQMVGGC